jgi:hypothetical protein
MTEKNSIYIILIIVLLLGIIILLSGVKICKIPYDKASLNGRYIDTRYKYISEPFIADPLSKVDPLIESSIDMIEIAYTQSVDQEKQNKKIGELKDQISILENKIKVLDQII